MLVFPCDFPSFGRQENLQTSDQTSNFEFDGENTRKQHEDVVSPSQEFVGCGRLAAIEADGLQPRPPLT